MYLQHFVPLCAKTLQIMLRQVSGNYQRLAYIINDY